RGLYTVGKFVPVLELQCLVIGKSVIGGEREPEVGRAAGSAHFAANQFTAIRTYIAQRDHVAAAEGALQRYVPLAHLRKLKTGIEPVFKGEREWRVAAVKELRRVE